MLQGLQQSEGEGKHRESMQLFDTDIMKVNHAAMHGGRSVAETEGGSCSSPQARRFDFLSWSEPGWRPGIPAAASSAFHHAGGGDEAARSLLAWITTEAPEEEPGHYPQSDMQVGMCQFIFGVGPACSEDSAGVRCVIRAQCFYFPLFGDFCGVFALIICYDYNVRCRDCSWTSAWTNTARAHQSCSP